MQVADFETFFVSRYLVPYSTYLPTTVASSNEVKIEEMRKDTNVF